MGGREGVVIVVCLPVKDACHMLSGGYPTKEAIYFARRLYMPTLYKVLM
jgi:hypothetical protein